MKRVFAPTRTGAEWQVLLAKPELHWEPGRSAMTAAAAWESAADKLPPEISTLLDSTQEPLLKGQRLLVAIPEWQVPLPGGTTNSCTDVLAICRNDLGLCVLGVEAKVHENFGPLVSEKRAGASAGQQERLRYLHELLGVVQFHDDIRYQLLHRTASALLTAREFHAAAAVMMVHAFDTPEPRQRDFEAFREALDGQRVAPLVYKVPGFAAPALYLAWCDGDVKFLDKTLPSAL